MPNRIHVAFVAGLLATATFGIAQTATQIKEVPVKETSPASGKQMYSTYCAVCHGVDGKGSGPAWAKDRRFFDENWGPDLPGEEPIREECGGGAPPP